MIFSPVSVSGSFGHSDLGIHYPGWETRLSKRLALELSFSAAMEVVNETCAMLSNYEVLSLMEDIQRGQNNQKKPSQHQTHLATISYSTIKYLEKTPCRVQNPEIIGKFMRALEPYHLTKAEKLQLLNLRPSSAVEIQLLIEESEERLTEEQIEELLSVVAEHLGQEVVSEEVEEETG